jgi:transcriptional regulator with XRE-family HTH domain
VAEPPGPFADALRRLRAAAGLTQEALAGAAGPPVANQEAASL